MAITDDDICGIIALWQYGEQQADPRSNEDDIVSGLRQTQLVSCQYWIKGLSPICNNWGDENGCGFITPPGEQGPSGYNSGNCDFLGRQFTCDRYQSSATEDLEEYHCILPNIFLSGLGKASGTAVTGLILNAIPKEEINGYCDGKCDSYGRGTGCGGIPGTSPIVCNYFRPWQMGFGSLTPRDVRRTINEDGSVYISPEDLQAAYEAIHTPMAYRLPLAFKIYNLRAEFQKCAYWNSDYGARFELYDDGDIYLDADSEDPSEGCTCTDINCRPYCTLDTPPEGSQEWLLDQVWSQAGTVVCNGAKPECPCYTGEWIYCNDISMLTGMRVTANQIFELRFWTAQWGSQAEYDSFFESKPNWQDVPTADIYTFKKWLKLGQTAADSVAEGQILHMCQPAPINDRRFIPSVYLTATDIQYTAAGINMGTTAPSAGAIYYPTLIRDPDLTSDIWPIDIVYPYASITSFSSEVCNEETNKEPLCIKRGSSINGDTISVIGTTTRKKTVYVFNLSLLDETLSEFNNHWSMNTISNIKTTSGEDDGNFTGLSKREGFFERLESFLDNTTKNNSDDILTVISDSETGYFKAGPLSLNYGEINKIVVCVKFTDTVWDFRIRPVLSKWYGGFLIQNSFTQESTGESLPNRFFPNAQITGTIYSLIDTGKINSEIESKCSLDSIIHTASNQYSNTELGVSELYSYCYKKITVNNETAINWARIGNSGMIWVEIEDTNINYLFEWEVVSAEMKYNAAVEGNTSENVSMKVVAIEDFVSGERSIPPSACILEPEDGLVKKIFFNDEWDLEITYWYKEISNDNSESDNVEVTSPDFSSEYITFDDSGLEIIFDNKSETFMIDNIDNRTVALMGLFAEEDGRIIASMATKMLVQVSMLECRNVEIDYRYNQPTQWYILKPETSMSTLAIPPTIEECQGEYSPRYFRPFCGDHKNGHQGLGRGPMWYPFYTCEQNDFYQAFAGASYCTNWFPDCPRDDMRFCGPTKYTAFVAPGGGSAYADCVLSFHYRYSVTTGEASFAGYANIVAYVDVAEYTAHSWTLPPFGTKGREMVRKWISQDNWVYLTSKNSDKLYVTNQWIPLVPDNTDFYTSFNSFSESSVVSPDSFMHINQLNFFKSDLIEEEVSTERKRFDEVFGSRGIWNASYPPPLVIQGIIVKSIHYYFKDPYTTWAWRERWEDISYIENERNLYFLTYEKPDYVYDYEKQEHRYICDESTYLVKFIAPVIEENVLTKYPSLQLGNGPKRFFEIVYDDYTTGDVDWKDEGSGNVDGSVEEGEEENIYEVTSPNAAGSKWSHDKDCLFDDEAVRTYEEADVVGRKISISDGMGGFADSYYNRGVIFNLSRDALNYLPYEEIDCVLAITVSPESNIVWGKGAYSWDNIAPSITVDLTGENVGSCISELVIEGFWGNHDIQIDSAVTKRNVCIPEIIVTEGYGDGETITLVSKAEVAFDKDVYGEIGVVPYTITFELQPTVDRMINKQATSMEISLDCSISQYIYLQSVGFKSATYVDSTESIQVYERMYITSIASNLGDHNIDGPQVNGNFVLQHDLDMDNSGTYYAISPELYYVPEDEIEVRDKIRAVYASQQYREDISLEIDISNISQIEQEEQKELYEDAFNRDVDGDVVRYSSVLPPAFSKFFSDHNIQINFLESLTFTTTKAKWDDHYLQDLYTSGEMWYPQGHKFQWAENVTRMRCYEIDYMPEYGVWNGLFNIMEVKFIHMDTFAGEYPVDPLTALYANRMYYQLQVVQKLYGTDAGFSEAGRIMGTASSFLDNSNVGDTIPY